MAAAWVCDTGTSLPSVIESPLWSRCIDAQDVGWWMRAGWQKEASKPPLFAATAMVVASPGGYVAAGSVGLGPGASLWTSTDGIAWVPVAGVGLRSGASADQLVSDARPVLLVGRDANGGSLAPLSAGGSADQTAWCVLRPRLYVCCCRCCCRSLPRRASGARFVLRCWRRRPELNPRTRFCRPLPNHSGTSPRRSHRGCPARIRTSVHGSKVRCPTTRRRGTGRRRTRLAGHQPPGRKMERKTGLEPATLTLAR